MDLIDIGKTPIPGAQPAGADPSYEPEFEQLQAEIDKLSMPSTDGQGIDWEKIVKLCQTILSAKGKHLPSAAYMAVALMKTKAVPGLADGVTILKDVTTIFWEDLFPPKKRMRGRVNALLWFRDQVQAFFGAYTSDEAFPQDVLEKLVNWDFVAKNMG